MNLDTLSGVPFVDVLTGIFFLSLSESAFNEDSFENYSFEVFACAPNNEYYKNTLQNAYPFEMGLWDQAYPRREREDCDIIEAPVFNIPDATPNAFSFPTTSGVDPDSTVESATISIDHFDGELNLYVTGGLDVYVSKNGSGFTSSDGVTVVQGDTIQLRTTAPPISDSTAVVSVHVGSTTGKWIISTAENDTPIVDKSIGELTFQVGDQVNYSLEGVFVDPNNHDITYRLINGPVSLNAESGNIEGKLGLNDIGEYSVILEAVDEQGAAGLDFFDLKILPPRTGVGDEFSAIRDAAGEGRVNPRTSRGIQQHIIRPIFKIIKTINNKQ